MAENVPPDFEVVKMAPPQQKSTKAETREMHDNLAAIRRKADGEWYRVGRFPNTAGASNRAVRLRRSAEYKDRFEFLAAAVDEDGYKSALFCRWIGAVGQPGRKAEDVPSPGLRVVPDDEAAAEPVAEEEEPPVLNAPPRRRRS